MKWRVKLMTPLNKSHMPVLIKSLFLWRGFLRRERSCQRLN